MSNVCGSCEACNDCESYPCVVNTGGSCHSPLTDREKRMLELLRKFVAEYNDMLRGSVTTDETRALLAEIDGET